MKIKIKEFWQQHETKIILIFGFMLVSALSFEAGLLKGREIRENPIIVEKTSSGQAVCGADADRAEENAPRAQNLAQEASNTSGSSNSSTENCAYVGSKNSDKYHLPGCQWAKRIKPENITCFKDENEAKSKGYLPDKNCIK
ncbi:MAG TPA: hypothetical protein PLK35_01045 [Candidatus Moranbacteria bacterium]|nr:hypothetical protein [Candidatus Moranbacteria bacterium]